MLIAGVDIGNSTTEICISKVDKTGRLTFLTTVSTETTGVKGTLTNTKGVSQALEKGCQNLGISIGEIQLIRMNEATPVIGDTAMETITETIISGSTMIGHNPDTPAGDGLAVGISKRIENLGNSDEPVLAVISKQFDYEKAAIILNTSKANVVGGILQKDEAVLVGNRLNKKIPLIDEVTRLEELPINQLTAIEVARKGTRITTLSNPYGIAKVFSLNTDETRQAIPIAKSLIGKKSAVVIKTIQGGVTEKELKAGKLTFIDKTGERKTVDVDEGAKSIMSTLNDVHELMDIEAEEGTYIYEMLNRMKVDLEEISTKEGEAIGIKDLLAIDTFVPVKVQGALAGEAAMEKAVAIAAMVKTNHLPMNQLAKQLETDMGTKVNVAGVEAVMAAVGALTTRGTKLPLAILDLGGGSTDAAILDQGGRVVSTHLAGAGSFITMMINEELDLNNLVSAELIKRYPLAKVNSLYHITMENGEVIFYKEPLNPKLYARVVIVKKNELLPIEADHTMETIIETRRSIKEKVFVNNAIRALEAIAPGNNIKKIPNVVLVGGSALDQEIPELIQKALAEYNIVAGRGDIQGMLGPRNAVATGLCMSYVSEVTNWNK